MIPDHTIYLTRSAIELQSTMVTVEASQTLDILLLSHRDCLTWHCPVLCDRYDQKSGRLATWSVTVLSGMYCEWWTGCITEWNFLLQNYWRFCHNINFGMPSIICWIVWLRLMLKSVCVVMSHTTVLMAVFLVSQSPSLLWLPYVIGQAIIFLPLVCFFLLLLLFFPGLISAAADWMSTIFPHMVWP